MVDRQINASCVIAWSMWAASLALWTAGFIYDSVSIRSLALIVCGAAVTATIRCYFIDQNKRFKAAIAAGRSVAQPPLQRLP